MQQQSNFGRGGSKCLRCARSILQTVLRPAKSVDVLYDSAVASGLVDSVGDDAVQSAMAVAFATMRRRG